jgi:hypothetical protein
MQPIAMISSRVSQRDFGFFYSLSSVYSLASFLSKVDIQETFSGRPMGVAVNFSTTYEFFCFLEGDVNQGLTT